MHKYEKEAYDSDFSPLLIHISFSLAFAGSLSLSLLSEPIITMIILFEYNQSMLQSQPLYLLPVHNAQWK